MRTKIFLLIIFALVLTGCSVIPSNSPQKLTSTTEENPPQYNPNKSITYNKPYTDLQDELLYARVTTGDDSTGRKTIRIIKDKDRLIQIVKGFDKLKSSTHQESYQHGSKRQTHYVVTMWRKETSVSYVIIKYKSNFYYRERLNLGDRKMPEKLVELLEL